MSRTILPQKHCTDTADHPAHDYWWPRRADTNRLRKHCPGRHTPSNHRAPHATPAVPADPFAGIEEAYGEETD